MAESPSLSFKPSAVANLARFGDPAGRCRFKDASHVGGLGLQRREASRRAVARMAAPRRPTGPLRSCGTVERAGCSAGPFKSAWTCSMIAWPRWVRVTDQAGPGGAGVAVDETPIKIAIAE